MAAPFVPPRRVPYWITALGLRLVVGSYLRVRLEGRERLPPGPAILCFNHQDWLDPFVLVAALPSRPDLVFFGPKEEDMAVGFKNRLITWSGRALPFRPGRTNLLAAARSVQGALDAGVRVAVAPEGRIHAGERALLPLNEGVAFFSLRAHVPVLPIAISGVGWVRFGKTVRIRIGEPIEPVGAPTRAAVGALTVQIADAICTIVADARDDQPPGRFGRWVTELFNDWPEGERPAPLAAGVASFAVDPASSRAPSGG